MATDTILVKLADYLKAHEEYALRWQQIGRPGSDTGYWEIVYVTKCIQFQGDALASTSLQVLVDKLPE